MAFERRDYVGGAPSTTLAQNIAQGAFTLELQDGTGYPSGTVGPFVIVVDPGLTGEEKILCSNLTGNTVTVLATVGRGHDDTADSAHTSGAVIHHVGTAEDLAEANQHYADTSLDHHTQYLDETRHDIEDRHTFTAALGSPAAPASVGTTPAAGTGDNPAREDHVHDIADGAVVADTIGALAVIPGKIGSSAVSAGAIADNAVIERTILDNAVTVNKITVNAVTADKINASAVTTVKINDGAVTHGKMASDAIDSDELVAGSVDKAHLAQLLPWTKVFSFEPAADRTVNSTSYVNWPTDSASLSFTKLRDDTDLILFIAWQGVPPIGSVVVVQTALKIGGTPYGVTKTKMNGSALININGTSGVLAVSNIDAGSLTAQLQWKIDTSDSTTFAGDKISFSVTETWA